MGSHKHRKDCDCETKKECDCEPQKEECECIQKHVCECEKPKKSCCKKEKCCPEFVVGPIGPRGPRGPGPISLEYKFAEIPQTRPILIGENVVLSVTLNSAVTRDLRIIATASPNATVDGSPVQLRFQLRIDGVQQNNGAGLTLNRDVENREQRESASLLRRIGPFPPGPRTVDVMVLASNTGAQFDPNVGGATLLVEQIPV